MIISVKREYCVIALRAHHQQKLREKIGSEEPREVTKPYAYEYMQSKVKKATFFYKNNNEL